MPFTGPCDAWCMILSDARTCAIPCNPVACPPGFECRAHGGEHACARVGPDEPDEERRARLTAASALLLARDIRALDRRYKGWPGLRIFDLTKSCRDSPSCDRRGCGAVLHTAAAAADPDVTSILDELEKSCAQFTARRRPNDFDAEYERLVGWLRDAYAEERDGGAGCRVVEH